jgi:hypothetical protein
MRTIVFTHIQKTAGTTLGRTLKFHYAWWPPTNLLNPDLAMGFHYLHGDFPRERLMRIRALMPEQAHRVRYLQGHFSHGVGGLLPHPVAYVTAVRDPVKRVLSHFHQFRKLMPPADQPVAREITLAARKLGVLEFMREFPLVGLRNFQTRMLAGECRELPGDLSPYDTVKGPADASALSRAVETLLGEYRFVVTERFDESFLLMATDLGWQRPWYLESNVTKVRSAAPSAAEREGILAENDLDAELYRRACERLEARIADAGPGFARRVAALKARSGRVRRYLGGPLETAFTVARNVYRRRSRRSPVQAQSPAAD